jgi:hypothetical protein
MTIQEYRSGALTIAAIDGMIRVSLDTREASIMFGLAVLGAV